MFFVILLYFANYVIVKNKFREALMSGVYLRRNFILGLSSIGFATLSSKKLFAQNIQLNDVLNAINSANTNKKNPILSASEADGGIREALTNGAIAAVLKTGRLDGFWQDNKIKIPLPGTLGKLQKSLQPYGLSSSFDDLQLKINRAAENSAPKAKEIFVNAIKSFTINDAMSILQGGENAGTNLLKEKTKPQLISAFRPQMLDAIDKTGAGVSIGKIDKKYGAQLGSLANISGTKTQNQDLKSQLVDYAVSKSLDGIFYYIGTEEAAIRKDPAKRTSDLLKKVFGGF